MNNNGLNTELASKIFECLKPILIKTLISIEHSVFANYKNLIQSAKFELNKSKPYNNLFNEDFLNDIWVIEKYIEMVSDYCETWEKILDSHFTESWSSLQNTLDALRGIKKFSKVDISYFENQLTELEKTYPYNIFLSSGLIVDHFECSICGFDNELPECHHIQGELYNGVMAFAIVRNIINIDHVSFVDNPADKRCVISYQNDGHQFNTLRNLASFFLNKDKKISSFSKIRIHQMKTINTNWKAMNRNDLCFCGSKKKFKKCCSDKQLNDSEFFDFVFESKSPNFIA